MHCMACSNGRGEVLYCRLLASTLQGKMVLMQPAAASIVCSTLRQWSDAASSSSSSPYDSLEVESGDRQLQVESLLALSSLLKDNLGSISGHERIATLVLLQSLASGHDSSSPPPSPSKPLRRTRRVDQAPSEVQRQALLALATCIPQRSSHLPTQPSSSSSSSQGRTAGGAGGGTLSPDQIQESLSCIITALTSVTSTFTNPPPSLSPSSSSLSATESLAHSKFLTTLLRTLNLFVMESKKGWVAHAGAIVTGLKALMLFGAGPNTSASSPLPSALPLDPFSQGSGLKSKYTPPHLRGASSSSTQPQPSPSQSRGSSRRVSAVNSDEGDWRAPSAHDHAGSTLDPAIEDR